MINDTIFKIFERLNTKITCTFPRNIVTGIILYTTL